MKKLITTLNFIFIFCIIFLVKVQAKDFELIIDRKVFVNEENRIQVIETHTVKNNSSSEFISKKNVETFQINHIKTLAGSLKQSVDSAVLKIDGKQVQFSTNYSNEVATITVDYPRAIGTNDELNFTLEYYNYGLLEKTGTLYDLYISGLSKESVLKTDRQDMFYNTEVFIKEGVLPKINFVLPKPISLSDEERPGYSVYKFNLDSLLGNSIWMQFGSEQLYKFNITQKAVATLGTSLGLNNEYKIIIPRDISSAELYQKVYIDKIFPIPTKTESDSEGNFFAYFNIPSTDNEDITIDGYVQVGLTGKTISEINSGNIGDYDQLKIKDYLTGAVYWEVSNPEIQAKAKELKGEETNVYKIIQNTYNFVINKIDYNDVKRFGLNERQGALETLHNGSGVCMEYSDLFLTLLRAEGIPARAVFGYGYDSLINNTSQEAHQWVQVLIPSTNEWLDIDITWGESKDMAKGGILNHFFTHIAKNNPEEFSEVVLSSFGRSDVLQLPKYDISAISSIPSNGQFLNQEELLKKYPYVENTSILDTIMKLPQKINNLFKNIEDRDTLSVILLGIGAVLIFVPISLMLKDKMTFGKSKQVITDSELPGIKDIS